MPKSAKAPKSRRNTSCEDVCGRPCTVEPNIMIRFLMRKYPPVRGFVFAPRPCLGVEGRRPRSDAKVDEIGRRWTKSRDEMFAPLSALSRRFAPQDGVVSCTFRQPPSSLSRRRASRPSAYSSQVSSDLAELLLTSCGPPGLAGLPLTSVIRVPACHAWQSTRREH